MAKQFHVRIKNIDDEIAKTEALMVKSYAMIRKHQRAREKRRKRLQRLQERKVEMIRIHHERGSK